MRNLLTTIALALTLFSCVPDDNEATKDNSITNAKSAGTYICGGTKPDGSKVMFTIYNGQNMMYLLSPNGSVMYHGVAKASTGPERALYCRMNGYTDYDC